MRWSVARKVAVPSRAAGPRPALALVLAVLVSSCGGSAAEGPARAPLDARVVVPDYPFEQNAAITVDTDRLDALARAFIAGGGGAEEIPRFLFSYVPQAAFDALGSKDLQDLEAQEGLLYLSGFFGGVWLKGVLHPEEALERMPAPLARANGPELDLFRLLAVAVQGLNDSARSFDFAAGEAFLRSTIDAFVVLYGYNQGYLQSILERPPAGARPPADFLVCPHFMGCRTPVRGLKLLEDLLPLADRLARPPDERWEAMNEIVERVGPPSYDRGYGVWSGFLTTENMRPADYDVLLDLSAGFLAYCQALVLTAMDAWTAEDDEAGSTAVALGAGMTAWAGGYAVGLVSDVPGDLLPRIDLLPSGR